MNKMSALILTFLIALIGNIAPASADSVCATPMKELQAGVYEADFGNVRIKLEEYNKIVKMKLISSLNEDWTSVSTEDGIGQITGFIGNGSEARMVSQIVVKQTDNGFDWALLKIDAAGVGTSYFNINKGVKCVSTDPQRWGAAIQKAIGNITNTAAVNISNDSLESL